MVEKIDSLLTRQRQSEQELETLFNGLMQRAFRGELVPQDPNGEPASFLLEKIRAEKLKHVPNKRENVTIKKSETKEV